MGSDPGPSNSGDDARGTEKQRGKNNAGAGAGGDASLDTNSQIDSFQAFSKPSKPKGFDADRGPSISYDPFGDTDASEILSISIPSPKIGSYFSEIPTLDKKTSLQRTEILNRQAEARASLEARKRSSAGVGGRSDAVGYANFDTVTGELDPLGLTGLATEIDRFGVIDTAVNHLLGNIPGVNVEAKIDFSTNERAGNLTTFGVGEFVGDLLGNIFKVPLISGTLGSKVDDYLGTRFEIGGDPKTSVNQASPSPDIANDFSSLISPFGDDDSTSSDVTNGIPSTFGNTTSPPNDNPTPPTPVVTPPVNSTTTNGTEGDDLFALYRRMLDGYYRGSRT